MSLGERTFITLATLSVGSACGGSQQSTLPAAQTVGPSSPDAATSISTDDASVPTPGDVGPVATQPLGEGDRLPEPEGPQIECVVRRMVWCEQGRPTRTAMLPAPYPWCHPTLPAHFTSEVVLTGRRAAEAQFTPRETRNARGTDPEACCYVEYVITATCR